MVSVAYNPPLTCSLEFDLDGKENTPAEEVIISGLAKQTTLDDLKIRFSVYGSIKDCYFHSDSEEDRKACIIFYDALSGTRAIRDACNEELYLRSQKLTVHSRLLEDHGKNVKNNSKELQIYLENQSDNTSINKLNDDSLLHIFEYLSIIHRFKLRRVCKRWCTVINNMSFNMVRHLDLRIPYLSFSIHNRRNDYFKLLQESFENLREAQLLSEKSVFHGHPDWMTFSFNLTLNLHLLATDSRNLTKLVIGESTTDENTLSRILMFNQELRHLEIYNNRYITGMSLIHLPEKIHTFVIEKCYCLQSNYLCATLKRLKNLKCLTLIYMNGHDILHIFNKYCGNLEFLQLNFLGGEPKRVNAWLSITNLKNLRDLRIACPDKLTDQFFVELSKNCQDISRLELGGGFLYAAENVIKDLGIDAISSLPNLKILVMHKFPASYAFINLRNLQELDCQGSGIRENQVLTIVQNSPELRYVNISECPNMLLISCLLDELINVRRCNNDVALEVVFGEDVWLQRSVIYNGQMY